MKQGTIKLFGLLAGFTLVMGNIKEMQAIPVTDPVVDDFRVDQSDSTVGFFGSPNSVDKSVNQETEKLKDSIFDDGTTTLPNEGERNVRLEAVGKVSSAFASSAYKIGDDATVNKDQLEHFLGSNKKGQSTLTLQYDGADGGFSTPPNTIRITENVRTDVNGLTNNVFAIRDFTLESGTADSIEIKVELFDNGGNSITVEDAEGGTTGFFDVTGESGDIFIALQESDITQPPGIDTDGRFFEGNTFDFTQVAAVEFSTRINVINGNTARVSVNEIGFERIPFEAESSIGIALLGAWGIWKRWKKQGEETVEESNVS